MSRFGRTKPSPGVFVDWGHPLSRGLQAWWLFNEGAGSRANDIVVRHPGTLTNMEPRTDWVGGKYSGGLNWPDGRAAPNNHITFGTKLDLDQGPLSVFAWFKCTSYDDNPRIMGFGSNDAYQFFIRATTHEMGVDGWGGPLNLADTALSLDVVYFGGYTYDGNTLQWYLDGVPDGSYSSVTPDSNTGQAGLIGYSGTNGRSEWNGDIYSLSIWDRALDADDVYQLYNNPYINTLPRFPRTSWLFVPAGAVATPSVWFPTGNPTDVSLDLVCFGCTAFSSSDAFAEVKWTIYSDSGGTTEVWSWGLGNSDDALVTETTLRFRGHGILSYNTNYWIGVQFRSSNAVTSIQSSLEKFTTEAAPLSITSAAEMLG